MDNWFLSRWPPLFGRGGTVFCDKRAGRSQNHGNDGGVQPPVAHVKGRAVE